MIFSRQSEADKAMNLAVPEPFVDMEKEEDISVDLGKSQNRLFKRMGRVLYFEINFGV